ncbi:MAG: sugar phosphate isomerase/epimerase [Arcicella sp.]|nr:sugar phosphate isomerase/epimerase [Arcicella sp.]
MKHSISRREALQTLLSLMGISLSLSSFIQNTKEEGFRIGACDWSINQINSPESATVAAQLGLDGVQVNLGNLANNMHLRDPKIQKEYLTNFKKNGIKFSGLAIGELNNIPYKNDDRTDQWVSDAIDVAKILGVKTILLAFFGNNDLKNDEAGTQVVIEKLKKVMPKAEQNGITLGIESWLSAKEHLYIINEVKSPNLKVYYDVANANHMGYDIYREIRELGKQKMICEFHAKENDFLLGSGRIDFREVKNCMNEIGYKGWIQMEGAVPIGKTMFDSYVENRKFMKSLFQG